ncbi:MAG: hypothetical protein K2X02_00365 [Alphaproteobacteria bacterium]|nr:hypothetical protein [Alphaproteobacteria bacterium]
MFKKFLRTSVLTLGAGLCVLATLQNECHAIYFQNDTPDDLYIDWSASVSARFPTPEGVMKDTPEGFVHTTQVIRAGTSWDSPVLVDLALKRITAAQGKLNTLGGTDLTLDLRVSILSKKAPEEGVWQATPDLTWTNHLTNEGLEPALSQHLVAHATQNGIISLGAE